MKRFLTLFAVIAVVLSLLAGCGDKPQKAADPVPEDFKGLVLVAQKGVSVSLYSGLADGSPVMPGQTYETEEANYYCYKGLAGLFRCRTAGKGYYNVTQNLVVTQEDNTKKTVMDVTPGKTTGTGWEPAELTLYTPQLLNGGFASEPSLWPAYAEAFTTPYFTEEHGEHEMTTQVQLETFLEQLDDGEDQMYRYSAGASGIYHHDIPLVIFTQEDLSQADTVEKAASLLDNGKPTIFYRAHIHGNEPAAGEAALAVIRLMDSSWSHYTQYVNLCIVPRGSPDGAQNYERTIMGGVDPNRDNLKIRTPEVESYMHLCQVLDPQIIIDGHEYNAQVDKETLSGGDMLVGLGYTPDSGDAFRELGLTVFRDIFADMNANALDCRYYSNYTNTVNANISRAYASRQGTLFFLLESRGIGCGLSMYPRRIVSHVISMESILDYVSENSQQVLDTVAQEKQRIIDQGAVYRTDNRIPLDTAAVEDISLRHALNKYDQLTGQPQSTTTTPMVYNQVKSDRIAPTAYLIPAERSFTETVLKLLDKHGIGYTFIPAGSKVKLQQYSGREADLLLDETTVTFPEGAYVMCRNQVRGLTLSMLMEPDIADLEEHQGTLVQQGIITATDGDFPIYRYIHDLNAEGFIDYQ